MIVLFSISLLFYLWYATDIEHKKRAVKSTDLSTEHINGIQPGMIATDKEFIEGFGRYISRSLENNFYASSRNYDQYSNYKLKIGVTVDRKTKEILSAYTFDENEDLSTAKGIKSGSAIDEVFEAYGDNYYTWRDREQGITKIGYVDHENNLHLSFTLDFFNRDIIYGFSYGYAFDDRLQWIIE